MSLWSPAGPVLPEKSTTAPLVLVMAALPAVLLSIKASHCVVVDGGVAGRARAVENQSSVADDGGIGGTSAAKEADGPTIADGGAAGRTSIEEVQDEACC